MPSRRSKGGLLARVNFPLYTLQMLTSRHVLVGGGGGSSKTGVANGFEIFELFHDGVQFVAEEVTRHETGPSVVMNCASHNDGKRTLVVAGQESHCQLYNVDMKIINQTENGELGKTGSSSTGTLSSGLRQRRKSENKENAEEEEKGDKKDEKLSEKIEEITDRNSNIRNKKLQLIIKPADSIQTDFSETEPLQRIVRISPSGKLMATGGTDGHVRLWKFPHLTKNHDIKGHSKEIDDIDFSPDGKTLITISKDGKAYLWDVLSGKKEKELTWRVPGGSKYMYKRCRFRMKNDDNENNDKRKSELSQLFLLSNATSSKNLSFLQLWNVAENDNGNITKFVSYKETLSALAVSDNGRFVAVGTMFSGNVDIFISFSLQKVLHVPNAHSMFITGLEFLPTKLDGPAITSNTEAAVVSISVDNRICVHSIPFRHTLPFWFVIIMIIFSIFSAFVLCSWIGI